MKDWINTLRSQLPEKYQVEFGLKRLKQNMRRTTIMAILIFVLEAVILAVSFIPDLQPQYGNYLFIYRIYYVGVMIATFVFVLVIRSFKGKEVTYYRFLDKFILGMGMLVLLLFVGITLTDQQRGIPSFVYLFISLALSIVVTTKPLKSFILYWTVHILFLAGNHLFNIPEPLLFSNYINMTSVIITVCVISVIQHKHQIGDFLKEKEILDKNIALEQMSLIDPLTGLYNRRSLDIEIEKMYTAAQLAGHSLSALMIDIDYFKLLNDAYGHVKGDEVLIKVSHNIKECIEPYNGYACRYGGDELLVLLQGLDALELLQIIDNLKSKMSEENIPNEHSPVSEIVTLSIGHHRIMPLSSDEPWDLINLSDEDLYEVKNARVKISENR